MMCSTNYKHLIPIGFVRFCLFQTVKLVLLPAWFRKSKIVFFHKLSFGANTKHFIFINFQSEFRWTPIYLSLNFKWSFEFFPLSSLIKTTENWQFMLRAKHNTSKLHATTPFRSLFDTNRFYKASLFVLTFHCFLFLPQIQKYQDQVTHWTIFVYDCNAKHIVRQRLLRQLKWRLKMTLI